MFEFAVYSEEEGHRWVKISKINKMKENRRGKGFLEFVEDK